MPRRFKLCLPQLFLPYRFLARSIQSSCVGPFLILSRAFLLCFLFLSCPLLSQGILALVFLLGKRLTFGLDARGFGPGRLLGAGGVLAQKLLPRRFSLRCGE